MYSYDPQGVAIFEMTCLTQKGGEGWQWAPRCVQGGFHQRK